MMTKTSVNSILQVLNSIMFYIVSMLMTKFPRFYFIIIILRNHNYDYIIISIRYINDALFLTIRKVPY